MTWAASRSPRRGLVLAAATLGFSVIQLDVSVVNVAVKPVGTALGGDITGLQWVIDAYTLAFAALILAAGALGDRYGAKRVVLCGFTVFTLASAACGLMPTIWGLVAARAIQGIGAAALGACSLAMLNHAFPGAAERARAVGTWAAGGAAAFAAGPLAGGLLIAVVGWRSIFFVNVPLGVAGWWLTVRYAAETPLARDRGLNLPGQLAAVIMLTALAGSTIEAGSVGFRSPIVAGGYVLAAVAGVWFVAVERTRARPMIPAWMFRSRRFTVSVLIGLVINMVFYGLVFALSLFFQHHEGLSPLSDGLAFLPATAAIMVSNLIAAHAIPRLGARRVIASGALLMGTGCLVMFGLLVVHFGALTGTLIGALSLIGFGIGPITVSITSDLLGSTDASWSGVASGILTAFRQTGSVLGVALFGSLLAGTGATVGLRIATAMAVGFMLLVVGLNAAASCGVDDRS